MPLPSPDYLTDEYINWNDTTIQAVLIDGTLDGGTTKRIARWEHLDTYGKIKLHEIIMAYADKNSELEADALPIPASPSWQVVDYANSVVGGNPSGLLGASGATVEGVDVTTLADVAYSLDGTYFTFSSPTTDYYTWYSVAGVQEVTDFLAVGDTDGSLAGKYFNIDSPTTPYYVWYNVPSRLETSLLDFAPSSGAGMTNGPGSPGMWFEFYDSAQNTGLPYYVWFNVTDAGGNTDPAPYPPGQSVQVPILSADGGIQITPKVMAAINAALSPGIAIASIVGPGPMDLTINLAAPGPSTGVLSFVGPGWGNPTGGAGNQILITSITPGIFSVDPAPGGRTGIPVAIVAGNNADNVAIASSGVMDGHVDFDSSFTAGGPFGDFTVTCTNGGATADAADVNTGFGVTTTIQGVGGAVDPAPGGTGLMVALLPNDTAYDVADKTAVVVDAHPEFTAVAPFDDIAIRNVNPGDVTDATAGTSGFGIVPKQGTDTPAEIYTATVIVDDTPIPVSVSGDDATTFTDLISEINIDLGAAAAASIENGNIEITSATTGNTSNVSITTDDLFRFTNGFIVVDTIYPGVDDINEVLTLIEHRPGQPIREVFAVRDVKREPGGAGSAIDSTLVYFDHVDEVWKYLHNRANV